MLARERQSKIIEITDSRGSISAIELMEILNASESTIRRDLSVLDEKGLINRVHGGAVSVYQIIRTTDEAIESRKSQNIEEKMQIARYAASLIEAGDFVYIDAGTTTELLIDYIDVRGAYFVTNALGHAKKLAAKGYKVYVPGGEFKVETEAIVGEEALESIQKYNFTKGFWGTNGITVKNGFTTPESKEAMIKKKSMENCKNRYVLADASKFDSISGIMFAHFDSANVITTQANGSYAKYKNVININPKERG